MKLPLVTKRDEGMSGIFIFKSCKPFVNNTRALLVHRPRQITVHKLAQHDPHLAVHYYCGNSACGVDNFEFMDSPPEDKLVCEKCEALAIAAGLPSSDELVGHHVHIGRTFAKQTCCGVRHDEHNQ